jgi:hypothetical protein
LDGFVVLLSKGARVTGHNCPIFEIG